MKLFKKKITPEAVDQLNTVNALADRPMIKVCKLCLHYEDKHGVETCTRDLYAGFNRVTGEDDVLGDTHYCSGERELKGEREILVKNGTCCGAIGQHWEPAPEPKKSFWRIW